MTEATIDKISKSDMKDMLEHAMHLGHPTYRWHPKMRQYIHLKKNGIHIFDLEQTYIHLIKAMDFVESLGKEGKVLLFVNTKMQAQTMISRAAKRCELPYIDSKWFPGLLTNFKTLKSRIRYFKKLKEEKENGQLEEKYVKKEVVMLEKEIEKLENALGGVEDLSKLPHAIFVTDVKREAIAVKEAKKLHIPVIAITDTNVDPTGIDYIIPANDDSVKSLQYIIDHLRDSYLKGKDLAKK